MKKLFLNLFILAAMLLGLPLLGIIFAGYPVGRYFEFPPVSRYVYHAPFSWTVFSVYTLLILAAATPLLYLSIKSFRKFKIQSPPAKNFPWWGWLGTLMGTVSWIMAWTRFPWFARFQPHTFTLLWVSFILVINALCYRRTGQCMMINQTRFFLLLFPTSAVFWWFFEYLNRFVQNWNYTGVHYDAWAYFCYATLSYSTVLPAVLGTRELINGVSWIRSGFNHFNSFKWRHPRISSLVVLMIFGTGLACIGIYPNYLFSLLWISPLIIIISTQTLMGETHILSEIAHGHWGLAISSAAAALFCGGFWEMWNYYSLARWQYCIPFVDRFKIFEMPILGYAGYLPFGLECAVIGHLIERSFFSSPTLVLGKNIMQQREK